MGRPRVDRSGKRFRPPSGLGYEYGFPTGPSGGTPLEQWLFDESSGSIVGEQNTTTCTVSGSPTFSVAAGDEFSALSPGITYPATGHYHTKNSADSNLDLDQADFSVEAYYQKNAGSSADYMFDFRETTDEEGYAVYIDNSGEIALRLEADDGIGGWETWAGAHTSGTAIHKLRISGDRSGNAELFVDGVSQGVSSISNLSAKDIKCDQVRIGTNMDANAGFEGTIYELRITGNKDSNSGGPGGG